MAPTILSSSKLATTRWYDLKLILILSVLSTCTQLQAQTPSFQNDTVRWSATGFADLLANVTADGPCQFITYGEQRLDWVQANGNFVTTFTPTSVSGSWPDLSINGTVTMGLALDTLTGQIVLTRTDQGITIELKLNGGTAPIKNSYTISSIEKL